MSDLKKKLAILLISIIFSISLAETVIYILYKTGRLSIRKPSYRLSAAIHPDTELFWSDINPVFGVWHLPNRQKRHVKSCFDVIYRSNSHGARDRQREKRSNTSRIVVLGDSFIEGWGLQDQQRLTDILERISGQDHLNFGTSGNFSPTQSSLLYQNLASRFDHEAVLLCLFPTNDFKENSYEFGKRYMQDRYRPYYIGQYPDYRLIYYQPALSDSTWSFSLNKATHDDSNTFSRLLSEFSYTWQALTYIRSVYSYRSAEQAEAEGIDEKKHAPALSKLLIQHKKPVSAYESFSEDDWKLLRFNIEQLVKAASGKNLCIFTVPDSTALKKFNRNEPPKLTVLMSDLSEELGFIYLDLLSPMAENPDAAEDYFLDCDPHWNEAGNLLTAEFIFENWSYYASN